MQRILAGAPVLPAETPIPGHGPGLTALEAAAVQAGMCSPSAGRGSAA